MRRRQLQEEDAWGSDAEGQGTPTSVAQARQWEARSKKLVTAASCATSKQQTPQPAAAGQHADRQIGPDSLHSICLGLLGNHFEDLLRDPYLREDILPLLPTHVKSCLLAVARLRRLLCDAALLLLADQDQTILDLHGCGDLLSDGGIRAAVRRMPQLRHADLTSCPVSSATLRALGECCPGLEVLRLGSALTDQSAGRGLRDILPVLDKRRQQAPAADSWHHLLEVDDSHALSAAVAGGGRLMQLQCLAWPSIPFRAAEHCRTVCPKVALNPSAEDVARRRLPAACNSAVDLDAPLLAEVSNSRRWEAAAEQQHHCEPLMHIAERFRLAYISRAQRVKAKMDRSHQQQRRREVRQIAAAEQFSRQWEGDL